MIKWKLIHQDRHLFIDNENGMLLGYNPNSGIKIIEKDGFAFKDLNQDGKLNKMEDWRVPLKDRVEDFKNCYHIVQIGDTIYYKKGTLKFSQNISFHKMDMRTDVLASLLNEGNMDEQYLRDNYILVVMVMMFDKDTEGALQDYMIQTFLQGVEKGLLDNLMYSISKAIQTYMQQYFHKPCLQV